MKRIPVIQLSTLRSVWRWYEKPITIRFNLSFKKSSLIILALCLYIAYPLLAHAQSPVILKPSAQAGNTIGTDTPTKGTYPTPGGLSVYKDMFLTDLQQHNDLLAKQAADLKAQQEAQAVEAQKEEQAAIQQPVQESVTVVTPVYQAPAIVSNCGDNSYANYIYEHESGCNLGSVNALGCRGIGQACPGSKLPCGADYACQNAFFTAYAVATYGGWQQAYNFWLAHSWW